MSREPIRDLSGRWDAPLLGLLHCVPLPLLLQPPAGLLQLGEGVWRRVGGHGRVLDEGVRGLDLGRGRAGDGRRAGRRAVAQLRRHPGVHGAGSLHRRGPRSLAAGGRSPGAAGAAAAGDTEEEHRLHCAEGGCPNSRLTPKVTLQSVASCHHQGASQSWP